MLGQTVIAIYNAATNNKPHPYYYPLTGNFCPQNLIRDLQTLMPQCRVKHTLLARGSDGRLYDVAELNDTTLPLVDKALATSGPRKQALDDSYIVVEWI